MRYFLFALLALEIVGIVTFFWLAHRAPICNCGRDKCGGGCRLRYPK